MPASLTRPCVKTHLRSALRVVALLLAIALTAPARADDDDVDQVKAARLRNTGEILPLEKVLERARAEHAGKVLETELEHKHGRYVYEIEVLDARGVVWEMKFDAKTGALLKSEQDD